MTNIAKKANVQFITCILTQIAIKQRLLEIVQEVQKKMDMGISIPHRLEMEFEQLSHELKRCMDLQSEAEIVLGFHKNMKFVLN
jgi:hypothetical protein